MPSPEGQMIFHTEICPWIIIPTREVMSRHTEGIHVYTPYPWADLRSAQEISQYLNAVPQPALFCQTDALFPRFFADPYYIRDKVYVIRVTLPEGFLTPQS